MKFIKPKMVTIEFEASDVVATSACPSNCKPVCLVVCSGDCVGGYCSQVI